MDEATDTPEDDPDEGPDEDPGDDSRDAMKDERRNEPGGASGTEAAAGRAAGAACERVRGRLERLLDGGLPPLAAARDEGHLEVCAECARERDDWLLLLGRLRAELHRACAPAAELAWAAEGLRARLAAARGPRPRRRRRAASGLVAAAAALAVVLGLAGSGWLDEELETLQRVSELGAPGWLSDLALPTAVPGLEGRAAR